MIDNETPTEDVSVEVTETPETTEIEEQVDELTALQKELAAVQKELENAKAQAAEYLDGWQRARAEFANYRRRQEQERGELQRLANATLIGRLLPVLDDLERAFSNLPPGLMSLTWIDGIALIYRKLEGALQAEGLTPIVTEPGQAFDPMVHEAITREPHEEFEEGQVIAEVQKGYKLGERVLRPTLVRVSSGSPSDESTGGGEGEENEQDHRH
jgi:molecular chaperone GrpE